MITVIKKTPTTEIKETYRLVGENNICIPQTDQMLDENSNVIELIILEHDQKQMTSAEMNELVRNGAECFDDPIEFEKYKTIYVPIEIKVISQISKGEL